MHGENGLVFIHERKVADHASGQSDCRFQSKVCDFLHGCGCHLAKLQESLEAGLLKKQCLGCVLALLFQSYAVQRERNVTGNLFEQTLLFQVDGIVGLVGSDYQPEGLATVFEASGNGLASLASVDQHLQ